MTIGDVLGGAVAGSAGSGLVGLLLLGRYLSKELKKPELLHTPMEERSTVEDQHLLLEVQLLLRDYWPHPILEFSGYVSTFWSGFWAALPSSIVGEVETLKLEDGGTVGLHWGEPPELQYQDRIVVFLPGLNNDSRTSFIQDIMKTFGKGGFQPVTLNYRGTGGLKMTSPKFGCADSWKDFNQVLDHIQKKHPKAALFGVGFSMGAGMLMRYCGEEGTKCRFRAGVALAGPTDTLAMREYLESSFKKRLINFIMASGVKLFMMKTFFQSPYVALVNRNELLKATTLRQIEEASIVKLHGYKDSFDYYSQNNPRPVLKNIAIPLLAVNAEDDPVVGISTLAREEMQSNPRIYTVITRRGGHIGWGSGGLGAAAWTDDMAIDFLQACTLRPKTGSSARRSRL